MALRNGDSAQERRSFMESSMNRNRSALSCLLAVAAAAATATAHASVVDRTAKVGDTTIYYKVVLPNDFDANKTYPGVLAFGGGTEDMDSVNRVIDRFFREQAEKRGYIVIVPADPSTLDHYQG